ncbi:MAG TPA: hypothetical protein VGE07_26880 [Herpetosiphonaceae bacterium]
MSQSGVPRFGRIPPPTAQLVAGLAQAVTTQVVSALPANAGPVTRAAAAEIVLGIVLRDWRENENTSGLLPDDVADLRSFVQLAAALAGTDLEGQGAPVFRAVLSGLMEDWLANWNAPGDPGPPGPY